MGHLIGKNALDGHGSSTTGSCSLHNKASISGRGVRKRNFYCSMTCICSRIHWKVLQVGSTVMSTANASAQAIRTPFCTSNTTNRPIRVHSHSYHSEHYSTTSKRLKSQRKDLINFAWLAPAACQSHYHTPRLLVPFFSRWAVIHEHSFLHSSLLCSRVRMLTACRGIDSTLLHPLTSSS